MREEVWPGWGVAQGEREGPAGLDYGKQGCDGAWLCRPSWGWWRPSGDAGWRRPTEPPTGAKPLVGRLFSCSHVPRGARPSLSRWGVPSTSRWPDRPPWPTGPSRRRGEAQPPSLARAQTLGVALQVPSHLQPQLRPRGQAIAPPAPATQAGVSRVLPPPPAAAHPTAQGRSREHTAAGALSDSNKL